VIQTHNLSSQVIVHLGHRFSLLGIILGCGWQLVLEIDDLLEEVGDLLLPQLKLVILLLNSVIQVHNHVGPGVYLLSTLLQLSMSVTQL
jgi:hypothetical protein